MSPLRGTIRTLKADLLDLQKMTVNKLPTEFDDDYFYQSSDLFGESQSYFRWSREMILTAPNCLKLPVTGLIDYRDSVRAALDAYVDGLSNCRMLLYPGHLLEEQRNGCPIYDLRPLDTADQILILALWPAKICPVYDRRPDGLLKQRLDAQLILHADPNTRGYACNGCGYDLWLIPRDKLGPGVEESLQLQARYSAYDIQDNWRDYELRRDFYRQQIEAMQADLRNTFDLTRYHLEFCEDNLILTRSEDEATNSVFGPVDKASYRLWYDQSTITFLRELCDYLYPLAQVVAGFGGVENIYELGGTISSHAIPMCPQAGGGNAFFNLLGCGFLG